MNIDNVINFPFPTSPSPEALAAAEKKLLLLGALEEKSLVVKENQKNKGQTFFFKQINLYILFIFLNSMFKNHFSW